MRRLRKLFEPIKIANVQIRNRIVMSPMGLGRATDDGFVTDAMIVNKEKFQGFEDALKEAGVQNPAQYVVELPRSSRPRQELLAKCEELADRVAAGQFRALFVTGDFLAADLMITLPDALMQALGMLSMPFVPEPQHD